jgi:MFS family permease
MVLVFAGANLVSPLWPIYRGEMHLTAVALTVVFAGYTLGALVALFTLGGLSDVIGRRPLLIGAVTATIVASLLFAFATNDIWLIAARFVQGLAVGAVSASANAALNDFAYSKNPRHPALIGSIATSTGFALGPFTAGLLADYAPYPLHTVFVVLIACALIALITMLLLPNTGRREGVVFTGNRASVPASIRSPFIRATATFLVGWVGGAFFLSLGPSIIASLLGTTSHTIAGATLLAFFIASGVGQMLMRGVSARNTLRTGAATVFTGLILAATATLTHSLPLYFIAIVLTGVSQGIALLGGLELVSRVAPPDQRAGVIAAFFFCAYLGVTVCVPILGWVTDAFGLDVAAIAFASTIAISAAIAFIDLSRWHVPLSAESR